MILPKDEQGAMLQSNRGKWGSFDKRSDCRVDMPQTVQRISKFPCDIPRDWNPELRPNDDVQIDLIFNLIARDAIDFTKLRRAFWFLQQPNLESGALESL